MVLQVRPSEILMTVYKQGFLSGSSSEVTIIELSTEAGFCNASSGHERTCHTVPTHIWCTIIYLNEHLLE